MKEWEVEASEQGRRQFVRWLRALPGRVRCVYEAGPCGYELYRLLTSKGIDCAVAAPSLTPRKPGDRIKTNRRDARKLAELHRAGMLTTIMVPERRQESIRDLLRARDDARKNLMSARHRLSKFLLRHGLRDREASTWEPGTGNVSRNCAASTKSFSKRRRSRITRRWSPSCVCCVASILCRP